MKKFSRFVTSLVILCMALSFSAFAHSGRTDSSGGHRDNKNISGLGYYHYHHGYPEHLHTNGVCPYKATNDTKSAPCAGHKTCVTDINAYINDEFIPCTSYDDSTYVIAEDLSDYGFDVEWNGDDRSLKITRNLDKEISCYKAQNISDTFEIETSDVKAYIYDSSANSYKLLTSYNIDGQTIIKLSDLGKVNWNSSTRSTYLTV